MNCVAVLKMDVLWLLRYKIVAILKQYVEESPNSKLNCNTVRFFWGV